MAGLFDHFQARIDEAADAAGLRGLLGEIGLWRAQRLMDIPSQRQAAFALSTIYQRLGESEQAGHEAEQLLALCRTSPEASREEMAFVRKHVKRLGRGKPQPSENNERKRGERKKERKAGGSQASRADKAETHPWDTARAHAAEGRWKEARAALAGRRGARNQLFVVWTELAEAMAQEEAEQQQLLTALRDKLRDRFYDAPASKPAPESLDSELARLLGRVLPGRRDPLVDAINAHISSHPESADTVAAAALRHHVDTRGDRKTAPWLFGIVARALVTSEGDAVREAIKELAARGAYAVTAYAESPYMTLVDVLRDIREKGVRFHGIRRGVLRRDEPSDRRLWTLRVGLDGADFLIVAGPDSESPYGDEVAASLARRLVELGEGSVGTFVIAPGSGNAGFRAGCMALGLTVYDTVDSGALGEALVRMAADAPRPAPSEHVAEQKPVADEPKKPSPVGEVARLFHAEEPPAVADYVPFLSELRRVGSAFAPVRRALRRMEPSEADARVAVLLEAVDQVAADGLRLPEATTLAVRVGAASLDGATHALMTSETSAATRFGGPALGSLMSLCHAVTSGTWELDRVLFGITGRERREAPALDAIEAELGGLWRLRLRRGRRTFGEVWLLTDLTPEGQLAASLMLAASSERRVVVTADESTSAWLEGIEGTDGLAWADDGAAVAAAAVSAWSDDAPASPSEVSEDASADSADA